jgi:hypothetical protein
MKRRYTSAEQITRAIDKCYEESRSALIAAEGRQEEARKMLKLSGDTRAMAGEAKHDSIHNDLLNEAFKQKQAADALREEAAKLRKYACNQVEKKAKKLGAKLAEFQTEPLFGGDRSVPV